MNHKQQHYDALVTRRKECRLCTGLLNPASSELNCFDSDHIGPWSRLHGDLNAKLMIVGQDWGDVSYYTKNRGLDNLKNPTMCNLERLLDHAGFRVSTTAYADTDQEVFLTNAVLCLKNGGLQAKIDPQWVTNCGSHFLREQIEIVHPRVVVGLGRFAFHTLLQLFGQPRVPLRRAIEDEKGCELMDGVRLFAAYHCGAGTVNRNRSLNQQRKDWERIGQFLRSVTPP